MTNLTGWTPYKLDQLGTVSRGRSRHRPRNEPSLYGGPYPFFQTGDIKAAELYLRNFQQTYSEKGLAQSKLWEAGTVCITIAANIAETAILALKGCFPDSVVGFVADKKTSDPCFIKYYIDTIKLSMQNVSRGTTQDNLSVEKLLSFEIVVPDVALQRKIASILSAYDDLIENNTRRIAILEEMAQAIYREWFVNFRFPGFESVKLVDSPLGQIPEGWEVGVVNDLLKLLSGFAFKSKTFVEEGDYKVVTIKHVHDGAFHTDSMSLLDSLPHRMPAHCHLATSDVLISLTGNIGRTCLVFGENYLLNQRVAKLHPHRQEDRPLVYWMFRNPDTRQRLEQIANGVAQQNLSPVQTGKMAIPIPPVDLRDRYAEVASPMVEAILSLNRKNFNLRTTRDLLLPKLISGKLDLEDLDIDLGMTAEVLEELTP